MAAVRSQPGSGANWRTGGNHAPRLVYDEHWRHVWADTIGVAPTQRVLAATVDTEQWLHVMPLA
eukprot:8637542-Alexandrium_andersonii.AAC.1